MFFVYLVVENNIYILPMDVVDNNDFLFHVFGSLKTIFRFYMDVVDNNDFLDVFHVFGCLKQDLHFTCMLWIIMTSFSCIWLLKTISTFYTDVVDNNDFLNVFHVFDCLN